MKIYKVNHTDAQEMRTKQKAIKELLEQLGRMKSDAMKNAHAELPMEFQESMIGSAVRNGLKYSKPVSNFTDDFEYIYTENA